MQHGARLMILAASAIIATSTAHPAFAQTASAGDDKPDLNVMIGIGPKTKPAFPGASDNKIIPLPVVNIWRDNEKLPVETPDESFGVALIGKRGKTAFGPTLAFATQRKGKDAVVGLSDVKFGMEVGGFAETYLNSMIRLRGEMRQGLGAHKALTADLSGDMVVRTEDDRVVATIGPRLRWGSGGYNRAYYGVTPTEATVTGLAPYRPDSGIYAYGAMAGVNYRFSDQWGVYGFAGYDRLTGPAADSPIVRTLGSRNQFSTGIAATYTFKVRR